MPFFSKLGERFVAPGWKMNVNLVKLGSNSFVWKFYSRDGKFQLFCISTDLVKKNDVSYYFLFEILSFRELNIFNFLLQYKNIFISDRKTWLLNRNLELVKLQRLYLQCSVEWTHRRIILKFCVYHRLMNWRYRRARLPLRCRNFVPK